MGTSLWYVTKYFAPNTQKSYGGRGHSLMKELSKIGYDITVISSNSNNLCDLPVFKEKYYTEINYGYRLILINTLKYKVAKSKQRILSWLHFEWNLFTFDTKRIPKPKIVIVSSLSLLTIFYGLYLKYKYKSKLIFEVRDIWPLTIVEEGGYSKTNPLVFLLSLVEKLGYAKSDYIVGTMPNLIEHVETVLKKHPGVSCIPMGIDLDMADDAIPLPDDYREKYLSKNYINVVYAGTVGITNALEPFLEAAKLLQTVNDLRFVIIGDGALREIYKKTYALPNLLFAPKIPRNMVQSALVHADILYLSTHKSKVWDYGLSLNKLIDYMRSGKPIIASCSGFPSMINEANCGAFIPANDTEALVGTILKYKKMSAEERQLLGKRGKEWLYKNRDYAQLAKNYHMIFKELLIKS